MNTNRSNRFKHLVLACLFAGIITAPIAGMSQNINSTNTFSTDTTNTVARQDSTNAHMQPEQNEQRQSGMNTGKYALMFQIDKNFTLKNYSGALISFQKNLSDRNAVRWGLNLNGGYNQQKNSATQKTTTGKFHIGVSMNYLWYTHVGKDIRFYYGLGPVIAFGYNHTRNSQNSGADVTKQTTLTEEIGVDGVAGAEWCVRPRISLLAEYVPSLTGKFQSTVNKGTFNPRTKTSGADIHFGPLPVRFGVSICF